MDKILQNRDENEAENKNWILLTFWAQKAETISDKEIEIMDHKTKTFK